MNMMLLNNKKCAFGLGALALILILAVWLRVPWVSYGLPFFYDEDEAHHFNRTVEMVKEGRFNPQYFHKPSLHFYLRMPIVAVSYLWSVKKGYLRKLEDIRTRDSFGIAGYAFSASHPGIVKWNRGFSLLLSVGVLILTFILALKICASYMGAGFATLLLAVSTPFVRYSSIVGVDIVMTFFVTLAVLLAFLLYDQFSLKRLWWCGLICGLAVSSKYNAAPVALLPILVCLLSRRFRAGIIITALASPLLGFLGGSPFVLVSLPLFLDHLGFELWHYSIAGHVGNMAQPGLEQAAFYIGWICDEALGNAALALAILGLLSFVLNRSKIATIFIAFPLLYFLLMIAQKANFTRNMIVMLPFIAIISARGLSIIMQLSSLSATLRYGTAGLCMALTIFPPLMLTWTQTEQAAAFKDSRLSVLKWLHDNPTNAGDTALAGELWFSPDTYKLPGFAVFSEKNFSPFSAYLDGVDRLVASVRFSPKAEELLVKERFFPGDASSQRLVVNPAIEVYRFKEVSTFKPLLLNYLSTSAGRRLNLRSISTSEGGLILMPICDQQATQEDFCWINSRLSLFTLQEGSILPAAKNLMLQMEVMSPWENQELAIKSGKNAYKFKLAQAARWQEISAIVPAGIFQANEPLLLEVTRIHSPSNRGINMDNRRLGAALRKIAIAAN